jgi:hypothetical protein
MTSDGFSIGAYVLDMVTSARRAWNRREKARKMAQGFADALMNTEFESIPDSDGMKILRDIPDLETGRVYKSIVVPKVVNVFWDACIETVNTRVTPDARHYRVAAVGTPGIGKTMLTPVLIRKILEHGNAVVYLIQTEDRTGGHYEFVPDSTGRIKASVRPERCERYSVAGLSNESTYYIVDPGKTTRYVASR